VATYTDEILVPPLRVQFFQLPELAPGVVGAPVSHTIESNTNPASAVANSTALGESLLVGSLDSSNHIVLGQYTLATTGNLTLKSTAPLPLDFLYEVTAGPSHPFASKSSGKIYKTDTAVTPSGDFLLPLQLSAGLL